MTILGPTSPPVLPVGVSDYAELRHDGYTYVDKSAWIADVLTSGAKALLVPRPRRFGKTLNMSALRYFVERVPAEEQHEREHLFEDTWIWNADDGAMRRHFMRHPVIELNLKDAKDKTWHGCWENVCAIVQEEVRRVWHLHALSEHYANTPHVLRTYESFDRESPGPTSVGRALHTLSMWLHEATGEQVVILIDEYDAPLNAAWQNGYLDQALPFFRGFLSSGLKDNRHLFKGVLTGILRVAKEGIFSGLNNLTVASILSSEMADRFGFTETEVLELAECAGATARLPELRRWYNGYHFGRSRPHTLYNPWSVLQYLRDADEDPKSHWKNTSDNALIRSLLRRHAAALGPDVESLLDGAQIMRTIEESVPLQRLDRSPQTTIDLLFFSGYLTAAKHEFVNHRLVSSLRIPNLEVRTIFEDTFADWLIEAADDGPRAIDELTGAMLRGDARGFERQLSGILARVASYHDFGGGAVEAVYQALILGLLIHLEPTHRVRSNRESGYGRADVLISPRTPGPGAVLELKVVQPEFGDTIESGLDEAIEQIADRDYATEVLDHGATAVHQYGVVFDGKRCWIRMVE